MMQYLKHNMHLQNLLTIVKEQMKELLRKAEREGLL